MLLDFKCVYLKLNLGLNIFSIQVNAMLEWMPEDPIDGKSILVEVMVWCCHKQAITWTSIDQDLPWYLAFLGHNDLIMGHTDWVLIHIHIQIVTAEIWKFNFL